MIQEDEMQSLLSRRRTRGLLAALLTAALIVSLFFAVPWNGGSDVYAAAPAYTGAWEGNDDPTPLKADQDPTGTEPYSGAANAQNWLPTSYAWPYPWSRNTEATGDWIADSYGLKASDARLFEAVTVDRLADVLSVEGGRYFVVFATPRTKAGQKLIKAANAAAKAANADTPGSVKKIYVFNPLIDDYQIDITTTGAIGNWAGNNSHTVKGTWTYILGLLANGGVKNSTATGSAVALGESVYDFAAYTAQNAVLFSTAQDTSGATTSTALTATRTVSAAAEATAAASSSYIKTAAADTALVEAIGAVFKDSGDAYVADSDVRTDFDFARRFWNAGYNYFNANATPAYNKLGRTDLNIFPTAAEYAALPDSDIQKANVGVYTAENFPLKFIDFVEGFNLLNTALNDQEWLNYFVATIGCHNSQAYLSEFAKQGLKYGQAVYINDDTLDGSYRFGTTVATKDSLNTASNQGTTANGWLSARNTSYKFSYLYGHTIEYLGDKVISKNETYKNNSIAYYYNGDTENAAAQTKARTGFSGYSDTALAAAPAGNAVRLQIPFAYSFNGDTELTAEGYAPVTPDTQFLHRKVTDDGRYSEYMMELTSVWGSPEAQNSTNAQTTDEVDGYPTGTGAPTGGAVAYAQAGRDYVLESVFTHERVAEPTDLYYDVAAPVIKGSVKVGETVTADVSAWPAVRFPYAATIDFEVGTTDYVTSPDGEVIVGKRVEPQSFSLTNALTSKLLSSSVPATLVTGTIAIKPGTYSAGDVDEDSFTVTGIEDYTLTATATDTRIRITISKPAPTDYTVTWKVGGSTVASGALESTPYTIAAADAGKQLTATVTATPSVTNSIYVLTATKTSSPATVAAAAAAGDGTGKGTGTQQSGTAAKTFGKTSVPTIAGKARLGSTLTAQAGTWSDSPSFAYAWYRNGKAIAGATSKTYKPVKADLGKVLQVRVTASKAGFTPVTKTSKATAAVKGVFAGVKVTLNGKAKVGKTLKAKVSGLTVSSPKIKYQWYAGSKAIKGATKATLKLKKAQKGKKIKVKVTLTKVNYIKKAVTSKALKVK
jgi:hypothetical protein